jgi:hypothetical protein
LSYLFAISFFLGPIAFTASIVIVAVSPAKGQTLKRMLIALFVTALLIFLLGWGAAAVFHSHVVAWFSGVLCVSGSTPAAAVAGWHHVHSLKKQHLTSPVPKIFG